MRALAAAAACALLLASPGCIVVSLHPAYDEASIDFDEGLVGRWTSDDGEIAIEFARGEWRSYRVTVRTDRQTAVVAAHLTHVGATRLLDVMPVAGIDVATLSIAVHTVYRVHRTGDTVTFSPLDYEEARRVLPKGLGVAAVEDERQNVIITAGTPALRTWLGRSGPGGPVFGAATAFKKESG